MYRSAAALVAALLVGGCGGDGDGGWGGTVADSAGIAIVGNPGEGHWSLLAEPRLIEELRIGSESGDAAYQFGNIVSLDVDDAGRIHVLDQQAAQVRVFDADGRHLRSLGRPGAGPGELSAAAAAVLAGGDGKVYVVDLARQRITAFNAEGEEVGGTPLDLQSGVPVRIEVSPRGQFVMQTRQLSGLMGGAAAAAKDPILLRDPGSERVDTLLELESGESFRMGAGGLPQFRLFEAEPVWALLDDGRIAYGRSDVFRIEILSTDGALERIVTRPVERQPVTEADRAAFLDLMRTTLERQLAMQSTQAAAMVSQLLQSTQFADHYPAYAMLMGGPGGTLWAQRIRTAEHARVQGGTFQANDVGSATWDVFDAEGRLLGPLRTPDRFRPMRVVGSHLYGVLRDELDLEYVVRLRVEGLVGR